jgi:hypothetical protein
MIHLSSFSPVLSGHAERSLGNILHLTHRLAGALTPRFRVITKYIDNLSRSTQGKLSPRPAPHSYRAQGSCTDTPSGGFYYRDEPTANRAYAGQAIHVATRNGRPGGDKYATEATEFEVGNE